MPSRVAGAWKASVLWRQSSLGCSAHRKRPLVLSPPAACQRTGGGGGAAALGGRDRAAALGAWPAEGEAGPHVSTGRSHAPPPQPSPDPRPTITALHCPLQVGEIEEQLTTARRELARSEEANQKLQRDLKEVGEEEDSLPCYLNPTHLQYVECQLTMNQRKVATKSS